MSEHKRWSDSEVQYLLDKVKEDPRNLRATFRIVAKELKRTVGAVSYKYYAITKESSKGNTCFTLTSKNYYACNRKQFGVKMTKKTPKNLFTKILNALFK